MPRIRELPTFYYLTHFFEFLKFVKGPCAQLLNEKQHGFIAEFEALPKDQQCLLVRACNRKSPFIRLDSFRYEEISDVKTNLHALREKQWLTEVSHDQYPHWLTQLTKAELLQIIEQHVSVKRTAAKSELLENAFSLPSVAIAESQLKREYVYRNVDEHIEFFLYLYFGNFHSRLNQFSMRDLGVMRTRKEQAQVLARFSSLESAQSAYKIHKLLVQQKELTKHNPNKIIETYHAIPRAEGQRANELRARLVFVLADALLNSQPNTALQWLNDTMTDEAQEKWCREAYKMGNKDAVEKRLETLIDQPLSEANLSFAEDFLARKFNKKKTSALTDMLRTKSQRITLDEMHKPNVEKGVVETYKKSGLFAQRTENEFWRRLFGLFFWEEIFEIDGYGLVNEFDRIPLCLKKNCLFDIAEKRIKAKIARIDSNKTLIQFIHRQAITHFGKLNDLFRWKQALLEFMNPILEHCDLAALLAQLGSMTQSWNTLSDGYPDIFVLENGQPRFEEIKSEGDQIRRNQLLTIQKLRENGFDVRVTQVDWTIDPMQPYVVVDIETTGGRSQHHRITEVGMVKMVNNQIVEQWQSLINPERRIPANITALTGIDNDMVRHAPIFAQVADKIDTFTQDCVFVAHNVNFDYGFIKKEFERLERPFRRPKLCTVAQMRKHYKGLKSYSLANLTRHFEIDMQRHHRAMSDAIAASELLKLVNERRMPSQH